MITLENFGPHNRDRKIGNSLYRICNTEPEKGRENGTFTKVIMMA